ncbi:MAG: hypothetical protein HKN68_08320, partial [Saprospiraceae bacterium]|nr:hypothetical protein [Saprospiraceae bacterium]
MTRNLLLTLFIILVSLTIGYGQRFRSINDKHPFARANVTYQDDFGFIWFGTREGLIKYDGYSTTEYKKKPGVPTSLPGTQVKSILQVSDSILFIGFDRFGLGQFNRNNGNSRIIHLKEDLDNLHVNSMIKDHTGSIWVGTNDGLYKLDGYSWNKVSKVYSEREGLVSRNVLELYQDDIKNLWIGTDMGIHRLLDGKEIIENPMTNPGFPKEEVINIQEDNDGDLWVSFRQGSCKLYKWDPRKKEFSKDRRFIRDGEFSFTFDENNNIWASSHGRGVYHFKEDEEILYSDKDYSWHGLRAMFTYSVFHDKYHNTWVESDEVFKMPGSNKEFYSIESDKFQVISVYADDDNIWYCSNEPHRWSRREKQSDAYLENVDFTELINPDRERKHKRIYKYDEWGDWVVFTSIRNIYIWDR